MTVRVRCERPEDTIALGASLGARAFPGTVIALSGDLGAGKTVLARGLGRGLGVTTRVQSPTFVIVQAHEGGRLPFWHADLYRLGDESELDALGLPEIVGRDGVVAIEWSDRFPDLLPDDHLDVRIGEDGDAREIDLVAAGPRHAALIAGLA